MYDKEINQEALDLAWQQSGGPEMVLTFKVIIFLIIAFFIIRYFVKRANRKTRLQEEILAELRKANTVNNSKT